MKAALLTDEALFPKATPSLLNALFPVRWIWHFFTRRFPIFRVLASSWNANDKGNEPIATLRADGIAYGEGPRFRVDENALYLADMYTKKVFKYDLTTNQTSVVYEADDYVSGLGWLPDGRLLIVAMNSRRLLALDQRSGHAEEYADVSAVTRFRANDMVVDTLGRAYVGNFGFDYTDLLATCKTTLVRVDTDRSVHVAATQVFFPNGSVVTPDGKTLIVAETFEGALTAFDIGANGELLNRRKWADIGLVCDGIALDEEGCVWAAVPHVGVFRTAGAIVRIHEGGKVDCMYGFGMNGILGSVFACQLATDAATGKHYVYFLEAQYSEEKRVLKHGLEHATKNGVLKSIEIPVGPARIPGNTRYCGGYC